MKLALLALPFIAAVSLALGIGCGDNNGQDGEADSDGVAVSLELNKATYTRGEPVHMRLTVTNNSDATITLFFRDHKRYEFEVNEVVSGLIYFGDCLPCWNSSGPIGPRHRHVTSQEALRHGETLTYNETWIIPFHLIFPGGYEAIGSFVGCRDQLLSDCGFADAAPFQIAS